jgi:hypothetical protein
LWCVVCSENGLPLARTMNVEYDERAEIKQSETEPTRVHTYNKLKLALNGFWDKIAWGKNLCDKTTWTKSRINKNGQSRMRTKLFPNEYRGFDWF